ncbi:MAG: tetratricopeptide repeat protein [Candidatus Xenobia bacterium]
MAISTPILAILGNLITDDVASFSALVSRLETALARPNLGAEQAVDIRIQLASAQRFVGDLPTGLATYEAAERLAPSPDRVAMAVIGAASIHIQMRHLSTAETLLLGRCAELVEAEDHLLLRSLHGLITATLLSTEGKHQEALERANRTLDSLKQKPIESGEVSLLAELYNLLGQVYFRMGNHSQALDNYRSSLVLADGIKFEMAKARALRGMGVIQSINRNSVEAIRCLKLSLDIYEGLDYGHGVVQNCISLGQTYLSTSDIRDSQYYLERAKARCERMGLVKEQAEIYSRLGNVHAARADYETARDYFAKDLEAILSTQDKRAIASAYRNMGWIHRKLGDHAVSEEMFHKSIEIFRSVEDRFNEGLTGVRLAETLIAAGRPDDAQPLLTSARDMFVRLGKTYHCAVADIAIGSMHGARKEYELATRILDSAIQVLKAKEPTYDLINAYYQLCSVHKALGAKDELIFNLKETIGLARHLRNYEMEKQATEMLAREDPMEWLKMMNAPLVGTVTEELKTERVQMSVMFGDIRGYSTIAGIHDCEIIAELVNEFCDEMSKVVYRYNGFVNKLLGDAVMAIFGLGQKCDPADPLRAAMEMQEAVARINLRNQERLGTMIQMGIGIATGEAVAGFFGSPQRREFTVIGNTVNLAARLQSAAQGGEVIVCSNTYREVQDKVQDGHCLTVMCKGFEQPQQVWEIRGLKRDAVESPSLSAVLGNTPPHKVVEQEPDAETAPAPVSAS